MTVGIGIVGATDASEEMVTAGLSDLRDKAAEDGEEFWAVLGINEASPEGAVGAALVWLAENSVAYDIIITTSLFGNLDDDVKNGAAKIIKCKDADVNGKVLDRVIEFDGSHLLVLLGDPDTADDELQAVAQRAYDNDSITVLDLADSLSEIDFSPETQDASGDDEDEKPDFELIGNNADAGDFESIDDLTKRANKAGLAIDDYPESWLSLAEALNDLYDEAHKPVPVKAATKKAAATPTKAAATKTAPSKKSAAATEDTGPIEMTAEVLEAMDLKSLRTLAAQSGIDGAAKLAAPAARAALLALGKKSSMNGRTDTGDVEVNAALQLIVQGFQRLANVIASK